MVALLAREAISSYIPFSGQLSAWVVESLPFQLSLGAKSSPVICALSALTPASGHGFHLVK